MKIDTQKYLTVSEAMEELCCSRRSLYRAMDRVGKDTVSEEFFSRRLILRSKLGLLRDHFYAYYSDAHQKMVKEWGSRGGTAKAENLRKARAAKR